MNTSTAATTTQKLRARRPSGNQLAYLSALEASPTPYAPRHGKAANWALVYGFADMVVRLNDGRQGPWLSFDQDDRIDIGISEILGAQLTDAGRTLLMGKPDV